MKRLGDWYIYCDICGQRHFASETYKLSQYTGRGGLIVCRHDADKVDYGLVPFTPKREQNPAQVRINHTNTDNAAPIVDLETMTINYYLAASQDNAILMTSQDDDWIIISEPL